MRSSRTTHDQSRTYGESFHDIYDRLFPKESGAEIARFAVAGEHPANVLELGVGTGRVLVPVAEQTRAECLGLDESTRMLVLAREYAGDRGADVRLQHDIRTPAPGGPYDLVLCVGGTIGMFVPQQQHDVLVAAARATAVGGTLVLEAHHVPRVHRLHARGSTVLEFGSAARPIRATSTYDAQTGEWWLSYHSEPGEPQVREFSFTSDPQWHDDIVRGLELHLTERVGSWSGGPLGDDSPTRISRYRKSA